MSKATSKRRKFDFHILPVIEEMGLKGVLDQVGLKKVVAEVGLDHLMESGDLQAVVRERGITWLLSQLSPEQRRELKDLL